MPSTFAVMYGHLPSSLCLVNTWTAEAADIDHLTGAVAELQRHGSREMIRNAVAPFSSALVYFFLVLRVTTYYVFRYRVPVSGGWWCLVTNKPFWVFSRSAAYLKLHVFLRCNCYVVLGA